VTCEYSESFDSLISGSSKNIKSLASKLDCHDAIDTDLQSPLFTEHSGRWSAMCEEKTPNLSASYSKLQFSRYFSDSESYTADFVGSDSADLNPSYSSFESSMTDVYEDELDRGDEKVSTVFSVSLDTDTKTCSSVSEELSSVRWKDENDANEFSSNFQHSTSQYFVMLSDKLHLFFIFTYEQYN